MNSEVLFSGRVWKVNFVTAKDVYFLATPLTAQLHFYIHAVDLPLPEVDLSDGSESGQSGLGEDITTDRFAFPDVEQVGQLYAYRLNNSAVVLRTRESYDMMGQRIPIGIKQVAHGMYQCEAKNANLNVIKDVMITNLSGKLELIYSCYSIDLN